MNPSFTIKWTKVHKSKINNSETNKLADSTMIIHNGKTNKTDLIIQKLYVYCIVIIVILHLR